MTDAQRAYQSYLQTDKWKTIRAQRLAVDNDQCVLCGEPASHVHHRRYPKTWGTETVNDLVSLCSVCHGRHHSGVAEREKEHDDLEKLVNSFDGYERKWAFDVLRCGWRYPNHVDFVNGFQNIVEDVVFEKISSQIEGMSTSIAILCYFITKSLLGVKSELGMSVDDVDDIFNHPFMRHAKKYLELKAKKAKPGDGKD